MANVKQSVSRADIIGLDYDGKLKLLEQQIQELLNIQVEYAEVSGRHAELHAQIGVIKTTISALQSSLRAEGVRV